jgi:hypothetical protein
MTSARAGGSAGSTPIIFGAAGEFIEGFEVKRFGFAVLLGLAAGSSSAAGEEWRVEDVASTAPTPVAQLKPGTIAFNEYRKDPLADPATGLIRFEDWARGRPQQKRLLSLYPGWAEPTIEVTVNGLTKPYKEKIHMYVAEARFVLNRPPAAIDLKRFATIGLLERIDPSIKHQPIAASAIAPLKEADAAHNRHPERPWCGPGTTCFASRYQLEGKIPLGIRLVNKLEDGGKKISEFMEFQSELRVLTPQEIQAADFSQLVGGPVAAALEQNIFWVNQVMQFGKFLALFQAHPSDPQKTVATAYVALAVETDVLEKKKDFERVPILRNLVPAQVLAGNSSFNSGTSISAGLPDYARNRIKAVAGILERE